MIIVKIKCPIIAEAMSKYDSLRIYMRDFQQGNTDIFLSRATDEFLEKHDKNFLDFYLSFFDWSFNENSVYVGDNEDGSPKFEDGDAKKFFEEYPNVRWKYLKIAEL